MQIKKGEKKHTGDHFLVTKKKGRKRGEEKKKKREKHLRRARKTPEKERRITPDRERKKLWESRYIFLFTCFKFYYIK